ncbi:MAG TPA: hypothetical protein VLH09_10620 [Bryobacteraceae bacterium]|nr:hypothetical protein [Bryobacteraceae bacterium]
MLAVFQCGFRPAVALLVAMAVCPGTPVLCFAASHAGLETPFAPCCGGDADPLEASSEACVDCNDVPLLSVLVDRSSLPMAHPMIAAHNIAPACGLPQPASAVYTGPREDLTAFASLPAPPVALRC